ncbi:MAG: IS200/IS605 family transposase [Planctomycetaceae bacterium]|jgi:REP element-mobilizing transposase RayT|nr:IS200/IS605 family transposase [Planctomycetaceae bacterium]
MCITGGVAKRNRRNYSPQSQAPQGRDYKTNQPTNQPTNKMSYVKLLYHIVIRTKASQPVIQLEHSEELYRYIWGMIKNKNSMLYRINGMEDHIHILVSLHPTIALSDFMREMKAETSKMLKRTTGFENFTAWSEGYAALTYGLKDKEMIINYIKNQREHHKTVSFKEEYMEFIREMGFVLDERDWER